MIGGRVLDATAVHDMTIGGTVYGRALLAFAVAEAMPLVIPAAALQRVWAAAGDGDYPLLGFLLDLPVTVVVPLDAAAAQRSGILAHPLHAAGATGAGERGAGGGWDGAAAHTVHVAQARGLAVVTADPGPLHALDPHLQVELLPT